jgi:hypothetical protein
MAQANLEAKLRMQGFNDQQIREMLAQMGGQANRPTTGDQMLAGGAGALSFAASQGAFKPKTTPAV